MTAYHLLPAAFLVMGVGAVLSYQETLKARWWFTPAVLSVGLVNCWLWAVAAKWTADRRDLYSVAMVWDVLALAAYNVLPLLVLGVRLTPAAWVGFGLVCVGVALVKWAA